MRKAPTKMTGSRAFLVLERAMKERLLTRSFGTDDMMSALRYFKEVGVTGCIYCDRETPERWDHLIPVRDGGATVLGNMVPACQPCDDSKGSKHYLTWLDGKAKRNPAKGRPEIRAIVEARVVAYQKRFAFVPPSDFLSVLDEDRRATFNEFQKTLDEFRMKLERFGLFVDKNKDCRLVLNDSADGKERSLISKNGAAITSLDEWFQLAPPKRPNQWADGRSAKELARDWLNGLPVEVSQAVAGHPAFGEIHQWTAVPEVSLRFDTYDGEPRNSDLVVTAKDKQGEFLIAVEGKADEEFDKLLPDYFVSSMEAKLKNKRSNRLARIEFLARSLLQQRNDGEPSVKTIRYQLLTACAGLLAEAIRRKICRAVLLVHEFRTGATKDAKHDRNSLDLDNFICRLSQGEYRSLSAGQVVGPISLPEPSDFSKGVELYIGKVTKNLR